MGACVPESQTKDEFIANFTADLMSLFNSYLKTVTYLKQSNLFSNQSAELLCIIDNYLLSIDQFDQTNPSLSAIDMTFKLHPLDYHNTAIDRQWLVRACLRQYKFIQDFPLQQLNFEESYMHYVQFLYLCFKRPAQIIVPNKMADFMWHSHMQDNEKYKIDMVHLLGKVLNHFDDIDDQKMKKYAEETNKAKKVLLKVPNRSLGPSTSYHSYNFIHYGGGFGGGGDCRPNRRSRSSSKDSHKSKKSDKDRDHHHKDHHHKDHHDKDHDDKDNREKDHHHHSKDSKPHNGPQNTIPLDIHNSSNNHISHNSPNQVTHTYQAPSSNHHNYDWDNSNGGGGCGGGTSNCGGGGASNCGGGGASTCGGGND